MNADPTASHPYNLSKRAGYQARWVSFVKSHAVCSPIGLRKAASANGRAGFVRIDTVHQGAQDGIKDVHHITGLDEVCQ